MYDKIACLYNFVERIFAGNKYLQMRRDLLSRLKIKPNDRVLETSIGTGVNVFLMDRNARYYGLDIRRGC